MEQGEFLGLSLPVLAAFIVLLLGLALFVRQLHMLGKPVVVRRSVSYCTAVHKLPVDRR